MQEKSKPAKTFKNIEKYYKIITDLTTDYIYKVKLDKKGKLTLEYISDNFNKITGRKIGDVNTIEKWSEVFPPEDLDLVKKFLADILTSGKPGELECKSYIKNKILRFIRIQAIPEFDTDKKKIISIIGSVKDITEQKKSEKIITEKEIRLSTIIENSPIGIAFSRDGITLDANRAYLNLFGYDNISELKGTSLLNQIIPEKRNDIYERIKCRIEGDCNNYTYESIGLRKDGSQFHFMASTNRIIFPDGPLTLAFFTDISAKIESEMKLAESIEQFKTSFENSPIGNCMANLEGKIFNANKAFCKILGYSPEEFSGLTFLDITHPEDLEESFEISKELLNGKINSKTLIKRYINKSGQTIWGYTSVFLHKSLSKKNLFFIAQIQDITPLKNHEIALNEKNDEIESQNEEYKQLNEELTNAKNSLELREQQLIEAQKVAQLGFYVLDVTTGIWTSSEVLNEIFGIKREYVKTVSSWTEIVHPDERQNMLNYFINEVIGKKSPFNMEYRIMRISDKTIRWVHGKGILEFNNDGQPVKMLGTIQDITDRKKAELQVKEKNEEIESQNEEYISLNEELTESLKRINKINRELNEAKSKAEDSDKLKSAFLANMSHEIRTPMNGIIGFSEMLTNPELEKEKQQQFINIIQDCSNQLLTIIDDLIDISKIESNQLKIEISPTNLNDIIYEVYLLFQPKTEGKEIDYYLIPQQNNNNNMIVLTDGGRLKQILINLLSNAIKFTSKGHIKFGYELKNNMIEFFVEDTGIGIEKEQHEIIFERFRQAEISTGKNYGGTGLGLSISKSLVQLLGGKIWVKSEIDKGTSFFFSIPLNTENSEDFQKVVNVNSEIPAIIKNLTILIAEDEPFNYLLFKEIFNKMNVTSIHAKNGEEAFEFVKINPTINLVLMDLKMPVMDGFEATRLIKNFRNNLPVIAQTAYAQTNDRKKAKEAGCDDFIIKPINKNHLINLIHKYIS